MNIDWERAQPAWPIDLYRTLVGLLAFAYFWGLAQEWSSFTAPDGYLDHQLIGKIFWFAGLSLYQPWMPQALQFLLFLSGWLATLGVALGWRPRVCAGWAWLVGTSHMRWNFPCCYLDDNSMLMALFWCMLLPTGTSLVWWRRPWDWAHWRGLSVPGGVRRMMVANLALAYWVTGLSKLTSSYWMDGTALYCILQLNLCRTQGWWSLDWLPLLEIGNYAAMLLECSLPLVFFLPLGYRLRWLGALAALALHLGILLSIGVHYANLCWIFAWLIVLTPELGALGGWVDRQRMAFKVRLATLYAALVVGVIGLSMTEGIPGLGPAYGVGFALQWSLGLSQEYHLFDWIDRFNFVVQERSTHRGLPLERPYPPGIRGFLLQSYLLDMRWMRLPRGQMGEWQAAIRQRLARTLARNLQDGEVVLTHRVARVTRDNLDLHLGWDIEIARFTVRGGTAVFEESRQGAGL